MCKKWRHSNSTPKFANHVTLKEIPYILYMILFRITKTEQHAKRKHYWYVQHNLRHNNKRTLCYFKRKERNFNKILRIKLYKNSFKAYNFHQMSFVRQTFEIGFNYLKFDLVFRSFFCKKCDVVSQFTQIVPCSCLAELFFMTTTKKLNKCDKIPEF